MAKRATKEAFILDDGASCWGCLVMKEGGLSCSLAWLREELGVAAAAAGAEEAREQEVEGLDCFYLCLLVSRSRSLDFPCRHIPGILMS